MKRLLCRAVPAVLTAALPGPERRSRTGGSRSSRECHQPFNHRGGKWERGVVGHTTNTGHPLISPCAGEDKPPSGSRKIPTDWQLDRREEQ